MSATRSRAIMLMLYTLGDIIETETTESNTQATLPCLLSAERAVDHDVTLTREGGALRVVHPSKRNEKLLCLCMRSYNYSTIWYFLK